LSILYLLSPVCLLPQKSFAPMKDFFDKQGLVLFRMSFSSRFFWIDAAALAPVLTEPAVCRTVVPETTFYSVLAARLSPWGGFFLHIPKVFSIPSYPGFPRVYAPAGRRPALSSPNLKSGCLHDLLFPHLARSASSRPLNGRFDPRPQQRTEQSLPQRRLIPESFLLYEYHLIFSCRGTPPVSRFLFLFPPSAFFLF